MLQSFSIALFLYTKNRPYDKLLTLASAMHDGLDAMSAVYISPVPALPTLADQVTALSDAITGWNNGKGSKAQLATLRTEVKNTRTVLRRLTRYMMNVDPNNPENWIKVGVEVKAAPSPVGCLAAVENLHSVYRSNLRIGWLRLKWTRPQGAQ